MQAHHFTVSAETLLVDIGIILTTLVNIRPECKDHRSYTVQNISTTVKTTLALPVTQMATNTPSTTVERGCNSSTATKGRKEDLGETQRREVELTKSASVRVCSLSSSC